MFRTDKMSTGLNANFFSAQNLLYRVLEASWLVVNKFVVRSNSSIEPSSSWGDSAKLKAQGEISNGCWSNHYWIRLASSQLLLKKVNVNQKKRLNWPSIRHIIIYTANVATRVISRMPLPVNQVCQMQTISLYKTYSCAISSISLGKNDQGKWVAH